MRSWAFLAAVLLIGCSSDPPETLLVDNACSPDGIGADETHIYWTAICDTGSIRATSLIDGTATVLVPDQTHAYALRTDDDSVYWEVISSLDVHAVDGEIRKVAKTGGSPIVLASAQDHPDGEPGSFVVDETNVYWTNDGDSTVMTVPKTGSAAASVLVQAPTAVLIAVDAAYVYWSDSATVHRVSKANRVDELVYTAPSGEGLRQIAAQGTNVFFWTGTSPDEVSYSLYKSDDDFATPPERLLDSRRDVDYLPFLISGAHLYWREADHVMRSDLDGGVEDWVLVGSIPEVSDLAANSKQIFWTDNTEWRIYTAPK